MLSIGIGKRQFVKLLVRGAAGQCRGFRGNSSLKNEAPVPRPEPMASFTPKEIYDKMDEIKTTSERISEDLRQLRLQMVDLNYKMSLLNLSIGGLWVLTLAIGIMYFGSEFSKPETRLMKKNRTAY